MNAQYKKGVLELCVLALLARKDCYGFELVSTISRRIAMSEGTVYPLLKRLKDDGLLRTYLVESNEGPSRKYYKLTPEGLAYYEQALEEWRKLCLGVEAIIEGSDNP